MKTFSFAVAVAFVLACTYISRSCALPCAEEGGQDRSSDSPAMDHRQTAELPEYLLAPPRLKRQSHLSLCLWCCKCCANKGCGLCCRF